MCKKKFSREERGEKRSHAQAKAYLVTNVSVHCKAYHQPNAEGDQEVDRDRVGLQSCGAQETGHSNIDDSNHHSGAHSGDEGRVPQGFRNYANAEIVRGVGYLGYQMEKSLVRGVNT